MKTTDLIKQHIEDSQPDKPTRGYLGMSAIGHDCSRKLWYDFRFCTMPHFDAISLLRFADGHNSEDITAQRIRDAIPEMEFLTHKQNGEQFGFIDIGGHFRGHCDGIGSGFPEFGSEWAIWEHKCSDRVNVNKLVRAIEKYGMDAALAEWNYNYYIQAQAYMHYGQLKHHLMTVSHSGSRDYVQVETKYDAHVAEGIVVQAKYIIATDTPPERFRVDPEYYQCKWCDHSPICHGDATPPPTCRTCIHVKPDLEGDKGYWFCHKHEFFIDMPTQLNGCDDHRYIPPVLDNWADITGANENDGVTYQNKTNGEHFANGNGKTEYSSKELYKCNQPSLVGDALVEQMKGLYGAKIDAPSK